MRTAPLALAATVLLAVAGCGGPPRTASTAQGSAPATAPGSTGGPAGGPGTPGRQPAPSDGVSFPGVAVPGVAGSGTSTPGVPTTGTPASLPVRLRIPSIGVDTPLQPLARAPDGSLQSPSQWGIAGWYANGTVPGQVGPAVIAGHVDSTSGPAVFYRLPALRPGDIALVTRRDGIVLRFVVDGTHRFPKAHFPTGAVYGPTPDPQLRLVTCTGAFDAVHHNYLDNLVVTAHLTR